MKTISDLEFLKLSKFRRFWYKFAQFFVNLPGAIWGKIKKIGRFFKKTGIKIGEFFKFIGVSFVKGDWKTKVSYFIFGFGNIARGQILRGLLFLAMEAAFIWYMIAVGGPALGQLASLGDVAVETVMEWSEIAGDYLPKTVYVDNSFKILLYSVLSFFFIGALIFTWYINIKQNVIAEEILATGKKLKSGKQDLQSLLDDQFHKTLLALPLTGITVFTVMPTFFMILVAFTNYSGPSNIPPRGLFDWVGWENFGRIFTWSNGSASFGATFGQVLVWTLIWAFFATFTNYFLGMLVALIINKKGIKAKKLWRTILVITIAIPQFISLLYVSKMFSVNGIVNSALTDLGWISKPLPFFDKPMWARVTVIFVNIWIGIPYLMLMISGVLMNIPADLYESSRIDGANAWQQYTKITLPYTLFVTGPYLLTSFTGNMNNFNVLYLLTGGGPETDYNMAANKAGQTDLLITWLFKLTVDDQNYKMASVIGILVFVVVAGISLIVYNVLPSVKNEEDFQ